MKYATAAGAAAKGSSWHGNLTINIVLAYGYAASQTIRLEQPTALDSYEQDRQKFTKLSQQWDNETGGLSNISRRMMHPAYRQIIRMQERAVPFMLQDFQRGKYEDWFWGLSFITGKHPIPLSTAGNVEQMAKAWIQWGRDNGYLSD